MPDAPRIHELRGILLDVDGTLYRAKPMRRWMLGELLSLPLDRGVPESRRVWSGLRTFRRTLESLRELEPGSGIGAEHYARASAAAGMPESELRELVREWMFDRPLTGLGRFGRRGLRGLLQAVRRSGRRVGVLSDYPSRAKLKALGVDDLVELRLCCTDRDIDALKPRPEGFLRACAIWGLSPRDVLYVGDRPEVDAAGARAAGMPCAIVGRSGIGRPWIGCRDFDHLRRILERR